RVLAVALVVALAGAATATAAPVTIGQLPSTAPTAMCSGGPLDLVQTALAAGNSYVVPAGYTTLTSWSTSAAAAPAGQMLKMKIFRHVSGTHYLFLAHDGPHTMTSGK